MCLEKFPNTMGSAPSHSAAHSLILAWDTVFRGVEMDQFPSLHLRAWSGKGAVPKDVHP